jgi:peroxiredoxin
MQKTPFLLFFLIAGIHICYGQYIQVVGNAPLLAGTPIVLTQYNDYITNTEVIRVNGNIGADGKFSLTVPGGKIGEYMLHVGSETHSLLLEPDHIYDLEIPDEEGSHVYYPTETDTNLILYQASNLDYQINYFSIYNYEDFTNGRIKPKLKLFIDSMNTKYDYIKIPYFQQYKEYKLAELMSNANYRSRRTMYNTYLKGKPILFQHPQYMAYFNEFYTGFMNELIRDDNTGILKGSLMAGNNLDTLQWFISRNEFGDDPKLAELICMKGLFDLYYMPGYDKYKIENLVTRLKEKSNSPEIKQIAEYFMLIMGRMKPGQQYFNFEGKDTEGNLHSITEYGTKNMLLTFFSPDDPSSIREITALKNIYDEFRKDVTFISLCSGCTYSSLQAFVNENKLKWTFLIIDPSIESQYEVISYPTSFFIDKEGKFVLSPSPQPSAGLSDKIYLYLKDQKRNNR